MNNPDQSQARENILARLRSNRMTVNQSPEPYLPVYNWSQQEKIQRLSESANNGGSSVYTGYINTLKKPLRSQSKPLQEQNKKSAAAKTQPAT